MRAEKNTQQMLRAHTHRVFISSGNSGAAALNMFTHDGLDGGHRNHTHTETCTYRRNARWFFSPQRIYSIPSCGSIFIQPSVLCASVDGRIFIYFLNSVRALIY
jgi:hypothetical protein